MSQVLSLSFVWKLSLQQSPSTSQCCCLLLQRLAASPLEEALQQHGEGRDGRHVQASLGDASKLECLQLFLLQTPVLRVSGGICPPDTRAAGVAPSSDSLALVVL